MNRIIKHRKALVNTLNQIKHGEVTIGFIGGSITEQTGCHNWPESVINWFMDSFPDVRINVENAGISGTASDLGVFRVQRDIIDRNCDLVFVEYAVNDWFTPTEKRNRTREGLIRKLLSGASRDIVLVYTFRQQMYSDMINLRVPASIAEFEEIADYYGISSVWMGLYAFNEVLRGQMQWQEWLPDGLHPRNRGSYSYGQSVIDYLEKEFLPAPGIVKPENNPPLPAPMFTDHWENACILPFSEVRTQGPWKIIRWTDTFWVDRVLSTSAVGACLSFKFVGEGVSLATVFGKTSAEFKYRIDSGEWMPVHRERPDWCGDAGWFKLDNLMDDLPAGMHYFELETFHGDREECKGTNFHLAMIGILK